MTTETTADEKTELINYLIKFIFKNVKWWDIFTDPVVSKLVRPLKEKEEIYGG